VSGMPFRLDIVETGEQWVVTCTTPHGKAVNRIPAPFSSGVLHRVLADIEKALIRSYSPVTTRRAAPVDQAVREFGETVGAENLCHQAIFMNHAPCAVTPLDPELVQVCNAVG